MRKVILAFVMIAGFTNEVTATELGIASYYQNPHYSGLIAAHKTLPLGARVKVVNLDNGRSAILKIVDRGPSSVGASSTSRQPPPARSAFGKPASPMCGSSGSDFSVADRLPSAAPAFRRESRSDAGRSGQRRSGQE